MKRIKPGGKFTEKLWQSIDKVFEEILHCGFVVKLSDGTLGRKSFAHYLSQDILYLQQDNKALEIIALKSTIKKNRDFFLRMADDGIKMEKLMHDEYLSYFGIDEAKEQSEVFGNYGKFLLEQANTAPYTVAVSALLPCFWVYYETGREIAQKSPENNKYKKFIEIYSGVEYEIYVRDFISIVEELGQSSDLKMQNIMISSFKKSTEFELAVFNESYKD